MVVVLTFLLIYLLGPAQQTLFLNQAAEPLKVLLNLALLPANYVFEPSVSRHCYPTRSSPQPGHWPASSISICCYH